MGMSLPAEATEAARPVVKKSMWGKKEDGKLIEHVRLHGAQNWEEVARALGGGRTSKSCRLRWCQHLDPKVDAVRPFTPEEDKLIVHYQGIHGNRWSTIAGFIDGRTDNAVKNRWNSVLRKRYAPDGHQQKQHPRPEPSAAAAEPPRKRACLSLFPSAIGDTRSPSPGTKVSTGEDLQRVAGCFELFPLAPGGLEARDNASAAASNVGAADPITALRLTPPAMVVFDVMPLQAVRM